MLTNLHDTGLFRREQPPRGDAELPARRLFGVAECEFRGYWASPELGAVRNARCLCKRLPQTGRQPLPAGRGQHGPSGNNGPCAAGLRRLLSGGADEAGVDLETGGRLALSGGTLSLPVRGRDFRLIAAAVLRRSANHGRRYAGHGRQVGLQSGVREWPERLDRGAHRRQRAGTVEVDRQVKFSGQASCHFHKPAGPGGVMIQSDDLLSVVPGKKYRTSCQVRIANGTGAKAYWMIAPLDAEGRPSAKNNLFHGFLTANQDWKPLVFEFEPPPGTAVIRLHFLVAFPGAATCGSTMSSLSIEVPSTGESISVVWSPFAPRKLTLLSRSEKRHWFFDRSLETRTAGRADSLGALWLLTHRGFGKLNVRPACVGDGDAGDRISCRTRIATPWRLRKTSRSSSSWPGSARGSVPCSSTVS